MIGSPGESGDAAREQETEREVKGLKKSTITLRE